MSILDFLDFETGVASSDFLGELDELDTSSAVDIVDTVAPSDETG